MEMKEIHFLTIPTHISFRWMLVSKTLQNPRKDKKGGTCPPLESIRLDGHDFFGFFGDDVFDGLISGIDFLLKILLNGLFVVVGHRVVFL